MPLRTQPGWKLSGAPLGRSAALAPWVVARRCALAAGRPVPYGRPAAPLSPCARWGRILCNGLLLLLTFVVGPCLLWWALICVFLEQLAKFAP